MLYTRKAPVPTAQAIASLRQRRSKRSMKDRSRDPNTGRGDVMRFFQQMRSRLHKRRLQKASDDPHTQQDAEMAVGLTTQR